MLMKRMMIYIKIGLVLCLLVFIGLMMRSDPQSDKTVLDVEESIAAVADMSSMERAQENDVRRAFGLSVNDYEGVVYYKSVSNMDVDEILIVKLKSPEQAEAVESAVQARIDSQLQSFQGYGAEQCQLLDEAIVDVRGNFIFYVVSQYASAYDKAFLSSL